MCLVLLLLDFNPFLSSWIALVLSCSMITSDPRGFKGEFISTDRTCDSKKCSIHMTKVMASSTPTSSASVELLVLIFCFVDIDSILPCPKVRQAPVWLLQSGWTANDTSIFQVSLPLSLAPASAFVWPSYVQGWRHQQNKTIRNFKKKVIKEMLHPHDKSHDIINTNKFSFSWAFSTNLLFCRYR